MAWSKRISGFLTRRKLGRLFGVDIFVSADILFGLLIIGQAFWGIFSTVYHVPFIYLLIVIFGILVYVSVLIHELAHSLAARRCGLFASKITLWWMGGSADIEDKEATPGKEFIFAFAGPLANLVLAILLRLIAIPFYIWGWTVVADLAIFLFAINLILFVFNMLPVFPMDGGLCLVRTPLWWFLKSKVRATRIAARLGQFLAIILAVISILHVDLWLLVVALFIVFFAEKELRQVIVIEKIKKSQAEISEELKNLEDGKEVK